MVGQRNDCQQTVLGWSLSSVGFLINKKVFHPNDLDGDSEYGHPQLVSYFKRNVFNIS